MAMFYHCLQNIRNCLQKYFVNASKIFCAASSRVPKNCVRMHDPHTNRLGVTVSISADEHMHPNGQNTRNLGIFGGIWKYLEAVGNILEAAKKYSELKFSFSKIICVKSSKMLIFRV